MSAWLKGYLIVSLSLRRSDLFSFCHLVLMSDVRACLRVCSSDYSLRAPFAYRAQRSIFVRMHAFKLNLNICGRAMSLPYTHTMRRMCARVHSQINHIFVLIKTFKQVEYCWLLFCLFGWILFFVSLSHFVCVCVCVSLASCRSLCFWIIMPVFCRPIRGH